MILRCKKMFEARMEVKRIIKMLIIQQSLLHDLEPLLLKTTLSPDELESVRKLVRLTSKLDSVLNLFRDDHKIFKARFLFHGKDQYTEIPSTLAQLNRVLINCGDFGSENGAGGNTSNEGEVT